MPLLVVRAFVISVVLAASATQSASTSASQPAAPTIAGVWVLNPALTQKPDEFGFNPAWASGGPGDQSGRSSGGRGRRGGSVSGGGSAGAPQFSRESADDSTRVQQLTGEARTPPVHITIVEKADSISIADDQGHSRTFHPNGHLEELTLGTVALPTTARWDAGSLVIVYDVERGRRIRYAYTAASNPARLLVNVRLIESGREGDEVKLTYEPPGAHERTLLSESAAATTAPPPSAPSSPAAPGAAPSARPRVLPPGSELRGLTMIGTVVEDLSAQATACGLDQAKIKASVARILADAGFKTERFGNEESYVLVSVVTSRLPDGLCVSRYDTSLVSQADATFSYLNGLVAVPVQLLHEGGLAGGPPAAHATAVTDALGKSVSSFVSQIRAANK